MCNQTFPVNWELDFDLAAHTSNMWNASFQNEDDHYVVTPDSWNVRIEPNETRSFGFQASYTGSSQPEPQDIVCNKDTQPEPLPEPWQQVDFGGVGTSSYDEDTEIFTLNTNPTNNKATHYVYQERSDNFTIQGCIQSLTSDDSEAKAGLMLRQDNTNTSEYVYIGFMSTGTEVEYVDDTGTVQTEQRQQSSTEVCYKIERKENDVLVYEHDENLNWVLVTTVTVVLTDPLNRVVRK